MSNFIILLKILYFCCRKGKKSKVTLKKLSWFDKDVKGFLFGLEFVASKLKALMRIFHYLPFLRNFSSPCECSFPFLSEKIKTKAKSFLYFFSLSVNRYPWKTTSPTYKKPSTLTYHLKAKPA